MEEESSLGRFKDIRSSKSKKQKFVTRALYACKELRVPDNMTFGRENKDAWEIILKINEKMKTTLSYSNGIINITTQSLIDILQNYVGIIDDD